MVLGGGAIFEAVTEMPALKIAFLLLFSFLLSYLLACWPAGWPACRRLKNRKI